MGIWKAWVIDPRDYQTHTSTSTLTQTISLKIRNKTRARRDVSTTKVQEASLVLRRKVLKTPLGIQAPEYLVIRDRQ